VVDDLVFGNALRSAESLSRAAAAAATTAAILEYGVARLRAGQFPELSAMYADSGARTADQLNQTGGPPMTRVALAEEFERGLSSLLDGIAAQLNLA